MSNPKSQKRLENILMSVALIYLGLTIVDWTRRTILPSCAESKMRLKSMRQRNSADFKHDSQAMVAAYRQMQQACINVERSGR